MPEQVKLTTANVHAPAANAAATITIAANANRQHRVHKITASYDAAPTGGNLKIEDGSGTTVWSVDIAAAGVYDFDFVPPVAGNYNTALIVTLAAGGAGVTGKLSLVAS